MYQRKAIDSMFTCPNFYFAPSFPHLLPSKVFIKINHSSDAAFSYQILPFLGAQKLVQWTLIQFSMERKRVENVNLSKECSLFYPFPGNMILNFVPKWMKYTNHGEKSTKSCERKIVAWILWSALYKLYKIEGWVHGNVVRVIDFKMLVFAELWPQKDGWNFIWLYNDPRTWTFLAMNSIPATPSLSWATFEVHPQRAATKRRKFSNENYG